jgi:hypothetical protein
MIGVVLIALALCATRVTADDKPNPLKEAVELGTLSEYFKVVSVDHSFDPMRGGTIHIKLEALKSVDTSRLKYKVGLYDKNNQLHLASEVRFDAAFPLEKGESIKLDCWDGREPQEWKRIVFRKDERDSQKPPK